MPPHVLHDEQEVTVSCAEGDQGFVYEGTAEYEVETLDLADIARDAHARSCSTSPIPAAAFRWWRLPADGVGLARMEFVINNHIKVHPMALVRFDSLRTRTAKNAIAALTRGLRGQDRVFRRPARAGSRAASRRRIIRGRSSCG